MTLALCRHLYISETCGYCAEIRAVLEEMRERVGNFGGFQRSEHGQFWVSRDDVLRLIDEVGARVLEGDTE